jgi:hypothetical protein
MQQPVSEVGRNFLKLHVDISWIFLYRCSPRLHRFNVPALCMENTLKATVAATVAYYSGSKLASTAVGNKGHIACANCQINSRKKFREKL